MLSIQDKLIFTRVKKAAIIWLLMLRLDPQPVTESLAADILQIDRSTARGYLKTLNELLIVSRLGRFEGYILTKTGKQLSLPLEFQILAARAREENPPSSAFNVNEEFKDSVLNTSLTLIKSEGGNSPFDGGFSSFEPEKCSNCDAPLRTVDKYCSNCGKLVYNSPGAPAEELSIDELIDQILAQDPTKKALLEELLFCRIQINWKTIALLYSDELTVEEIKAQFEFLKEKGMQNQTGILITNLLAKYKPRGAEFDPDTGHPLTCNCYKCIGARNLRFFEDRPENREKYRSWEE